eukprot:contig_15515_g3704
MEHLRSILLAAGLPTDLWAEAFQAVLYTMNLSPTVDGRSTPFERFYGKKANVSHLRVWGSKAYALTVDKEQRKLGPKVMVGWMVGYATGGKAYRVLSADNGTIYIRRDVVVDERPTPVPAADQGTTNLQQFGGAGQSGGSSNGSDGQGPPGQNAPGQWVEPIGVPPLPDTPASTAGPAGRRPYDLRSRGDPTAAVDGNDVTANAATVQKTVTTEEAVNSTWWNRTAPKTRTEALSRPDADLWQQAMDEEMASLSGKKALRLMQRTTEMHVVGSKWVFDYKHDAAGTVNRYKARLVMQGLTQVKGLDYDETWAPCPARATVRSLLAVAAERDLEIGGLDIKTAYLNAAMDKDVYIEQPEGYECGGPDVICKVDQALYGSKQAGNLWHMDLDKTHKDAGMDSSEADPCCYLWHHPVHASIYQLVHVDDVFTVAKTKGGVKAGQQVIKDKHEVRDQGELTDFLGMRIVRDRKNKTLELSSPGHTMALIKRFGMEHANPTLVPMIKGIDLRRTGENILGDATAYMEVVGGLLYLSTSTRPDLALAAGKLAQYMKLPEQHHWQAAKAALRYLVGTTDMGIRYGGGGRLTGAVDVDYAGCPDTRRSTAGWVFHWNGGAVSWASKREPTVATSTAEAKYIAAAAAVKEAMWLRKLDADLDGDGETIPIAEDNTACIAIAGSSEGTGRAKHIDTVHHLVCERMAMGDVVLYHVASGDMVADGLTKPLPPEAFKTY